MEKSYFVTPVENTITAGPFLMTPLETKKSTHLALGVLELLNPRIHCYFLKMYLKTSSTLCVS